MAVLKDLFELSVLNQCALESTRQSRWKDTTQRYIANMLVNNLELSNSVLSGNYKVSPTIDFTINERGHIRHIEAPVVRDRIVQKTLTKSVLAPRLTKCLIYDNYASLPKRGTSFARKRFEVMLHRYFNRYGTDGYILLIDIRKYFDSIDHDILKAMIAPRLADEPQDVKDLIDYIIDTSNHSNKGLNLGSEAPQIFAIYYLNTIDTFIKVVKGVKYYGRYMDDIFIIGRTKEELKMLLGEIKNKLSELKLEINEKKTQIVKLSHGFTYLQIKYNVLASGKILKRPAHNKIVRERRRLRAFKRMLDKGQMTLEDIQNCYQSWRGTFDKEHNAHNKTLRSMDALYKSLFGEFREREKISRSAIIDAIYKDAETSDLRYCLTI